MGLYVRQIRGYVCDRCGDGREVEDNHPVPAGWTTVRYCPANTTPDANTDHTLLLCVDCMSWLRKFLEGRKVAD